MKYLENFNKKAMLTALIVGIAVIIGIGVRFVWPKLKHDNVIEEMCEKVIYHQTGHDVDLTPSSREEESVS